MVDRWQRRLYAQEFNANFTVLAADTASTPLPVTMGASTILARLAAGGIVAATPSQIRTLLNVADGADASDTARTWSTLQKFPDNKINIVDDGDNTKMLAFEASGISGGTTRTWTILDASGAIQPMSYASKSVAGAADVTLTATEAASYVQKFTGALTGSINVLFPLTSGRSWVVWNATSGSYTLTVKGATGTGVTVTQGKKVLVWTDGTNFYFGQDDTGAAAGDLDSLSDVVLTGIGSGHVLYHNGSNWVNAAPGATSGVQPYDADLDALAALSSTGIAVRTGAGSWAQRSVAAGSTKISVTNGDGVSGNPTIDVTEANLTLNNIGGTLNLSKGGTNAALTADNGGIVYSGASALAILASTATAGKPLISGASGAPSWASYTANFTVTRGGLPYGSAANVLSILAVGGANAVLGSDGTDVGWVSSTGTGNIVRATSPTIASPTITGTAIFNSTSQILTTDPIITVNDNQAGQDWGIEGEATDDVTSALLFDWDHYDFAFFNNGARKGRFALTFEGSGAPATPPHTLGAYGNATFVAYGSTYIDTTNFAVYDYVKYS